MEDKKTYLWRKIGIIWLCLALAVVFGGLVVRDYKNMKYDEALGINLVMVGERQVAIVTLRKEAGASGFFLTPVGMVAGESDSSGRFRVGSLWALGQIEKNAGGRVIRNLENELGIRLTGYIKVKSDSDLNLSGLIASMTELSDKSNLNWFDRLSIRSKALDLGEKGELSEEVIPSNLFNIQVDPDGVENMIVDTEKEKLWAEKVWVVPAVLSERVNMAIYNNSEQSGKGRIWARGMEIVGIKVVQIEKGGEKSAKCRYTLSRMDALILVRMLEKTYGCQESVSKSSLGSGRVDVEVQIGDD